METLKEPKPHSKRNQSEPDKIQTKSSFPERLRYVVEYKGDIGTCLRMEKIKIYQYAELPENLKRETPLIRPPGNKYDT